MIAYLILLAAALAAFGGWTMYERNDAVNDYKTKLEIADKKLKDAADKLKLEATNHITDMEAAYEAGEAEAKVITKTIYARGVTDVATYPVYSNPVCVLPDNSLRLLNAARAGVLSAADTVALDAILPGINAAAGRKDGDAVSATVGGRGKVPDVYSSAPTVDSGDKVPGRNLQQRPKPTPIR
jgi:hypothetical protein